MNNPNIPIDQYAHDDLCVGIDLGTTNSVLAAINEAGGKINSNVVSIPRAADVYSSVSAEVKFTNKRDTTLPSFIYYRQEKNFEPMVGEFAKRQYPLRPHLVAKSIKSQMGKPFAEGLSPDIPDKTPSQISARILQHMLREATKILKPKSRRLTDVVITVPANFDAAMCKATRDAAQIAGIQVTDADGTERPILLSEPNAVIYDLINQIQNGAVPPTVLDLSTKKYVLVFDLGGGTLDITMHEITRREDSSEILKVNEIATNRYTRLGGDNFDEELAKEMYNRYVRQYSKNAGAEADLRKPENRNIIMATLRLYAENLKLELNERCENSDDDDSSGWDDYFSDDEKDTLDIGGNIGGIGYSYDDTFTREEIENVYQIFMGNNLRFDDYKRIESITDNYNIIYPILDVLKKASEKLGVEDVPVDAVILNGGMSKFYMVRNRLKQFFGFDPIVALDPDLSVARGAAVYHYYLHKHQEIRDDMRLVGKPEDLPHGAAENLTPPPAPHSFAGIEWGKKILNESLYLGVKRGASPPEIIRAGTDLPYTSEIMTGYRIEPKVNQINIPIMCKEANGTYRTIASGRLNFNKNYPEGAYVMFNVRMDSNKILTMNAWTTEDIEGSKSIERGTATIVISNDSFDSGRRNKNKLEVPVGSKLNAVAEISTFMQLCANLSSNKKINSKKGKANELRHKIKSNMAAICLASNKEDFAEPILEKLEKFRDDYTRMRLFTMARKIGESWQPEQKKRLAKCCMQQLDLDLKGMTLDSSIKSANTEALQALSICGSRKQLVELRKIIDKPQYKQAFLYTYGRTQTNIDWVYSEFKRNVKLAKEGSKRNIQFTAYFLGLASRYNENNPYPVMSSDKEIFAEAICSTIKDVMLNKVELISCILALGFICDRRHFNEYCVSEKCIDDVFHTLDNIDYYQNPYLMSECDKSISVTTKMLKGEVLAIDDERYLLTRIDMMDSLS